MATIEMDGFLKIMSFMTMFAIVVSGILSADIIMESDVFGGIDLTGTDLARSLNTMSKELTVDGLFKLGETESQNALVKLGYTLINGVDFLMTLGIKIILWVGILMLNISGAINLMILPFQFVFDIFGVGAYFSQISDFLIGTLTVGVIFTIIRFALFIWKGA